MIRQLSLLALVCVVSCRSGGSSPPAASAPAPAPQPAPPTAAPTPPPTTGGGAAATAAPVDTNPERNPTVQAQLRAIAGREQEPAAQVFKNVQVLKTMPAGAFIRTMGGYARATGGRCSTCHVAGDWPNETKAQKQVARQMIQMVDAVNSQIKGMQGIRTANARIGCNTCHRGLAQPAP